MEPKKIDFNYGENSDQPDMNKVTFEKSEEERKEIERRTVLRADYGEQENARATTKHYNSFQF